MSRWLTVKRMVLTLLILVISLVVIWLGEQTIVYESAQPPGTITIEDFETKFCWLASIGVILAFLMAFIWSLVVYIRDYLPHRKLSSTWSWYIWCLFSVIIGIILFVLGGVPAEGSGIVFSFYFANQLFVYWVSSLLTAPNSGSRLPPGGGLGLVKKMR